MKKLAFCLMMSSLCMTSAYAYDSDDIRALRQELNARNAAMLDMQNTISQQEQTIRMLQGTVDDMATQIGTLGENQKVLYAELEALKKNGGQATASATATATSIPATTAPAPIKPTVAPTTSKPEAVTTPTNTAITNEAKSIYDDAYQKMASGKYQEATTGFQNLIAKHGDSALVPNSYYWMGQMQYKEQKYTQAKENFLMVTKFKDSQKRADSIYKLGLISLAQKDSVRAKKFFALVVQQYPQDTSAVLAQRELDKLN